MGRLQRHEDLHGTTFSASCWIGGPGAIASLVLLAMGSVALAITLPTIWTAVLELFGPAKGDFGGWMSWVFNQGFSVVTLPFTLVGLLLIGLGLVVLGMGLIVTTVRRDGDDLVCGFGLPGWRLAERRIPLAAVTRLGLRIADRSSTGTKERVTLDLIVHLRPEVPVPPAVGFGLLGRLLAQLAQRDQRPMTKTAVLCKLTDEDEAKRLVEELGQAWNVPGDPAPETRPPMSAIREERERLERQRLER